MAPDYKTFLATEVISEGKIVSYRVVSRALKVHVNAAKCILYEFHHRENTKKPGSIYATYVVSGQKKRPVLADSGEPTATTAAGTNGDVPMPSSPPFPSSLPDASQATQVLDELPHVPVKSIVYCREDNLNTVKEEFAKITSIHIHSIAAQRISDLCAITETGRVVFDDYHSKQDPLTHNKQYGTIQNTHVWRRKGKRPVNVDIPLPKIQAKVQAAAKAEAIGIGRKDSDKEATPAEDSRPTSRDSTTSKDIVNKSKINLKREGSSLFKAFAKQSAKPRVERKDTDTSAASDSKMSGVEDEDEGEDDDAMFLDTGKTITKKRPNEVRKEKDERQAKLRKMMEDDGNEPAIPSVAAATDINADPPAAKSGVDADAPDGDGDVEWSDSDTEKKKEAAKEEAEGPKRRRGKRKVIKKRTAKDEDGYLVTKEEEVYESFSEDEPEPAKKPAFPAMKGSGTSKPISHKNSVPSGGGAGGKKKDIMSFFGKK